MNLPGFCLADLSSNMTSICYVTGSLYPVQSFADWPLEVWARAGADAARGDKVTVLWLVASREMDGETPRRLYRERGVELVTSAELEPYLAVDEIFGRDPALRLYPALRKLHHERTFDRIELPAGEGLSLRVIQASIAGSGFDNTVITLHLGKFGEWNRWRKRRLSLTKEDIKRDFAERESVEGAENVRASSAALMTFAAEIGWEVSHGLPAAPPVFSSGVGEGGAAPQLPCFVGEKSEEWADFLALLGARSSLPRWLAAFTEKLDETERARLQKAVRSGGGAVELLAPRRWDTLPAALREKGAIVVHSSGLADARLRWLAAEKVAFVFARETMDEIPALTEFSSLAFEVSDSASIIRALTSARSFSDWSMIFNALQQTVVSPHPPVPPRSRATATPRVLITVSHYNLGRLMEETLEALAVQDYPAVDVLVVDDGSTDAAALEAFRAMKEEFPAFEFVERPHEGYWSPRNFAIQQCAAPYIIVVDGDNLPVPQMASRFVEAMERNAGMAAFSSYIAAFAETREAARAGQFEGAHTPLGGDPVSGYFENVYGDTNSIFRIEAIRAIGGFRENFRCSFGDWEIFHRLVGEGHRLGVVPEVLLHYRRRRAGMIRQSPLYPNYFALFQTIAPGPALRSADRRRLGHALHGLALAR